jgi:hypothetical protein
VPWKTYEAAGDGGKAGRFVLATLPWGLRGARYAEIITTAPLWRVKTATQIDRD